jgi:peptidoglycan/LPS O-acetylase OafA/YrhL
MDPSLFWPPLLVLLMAGLCAWLLGRFAGAPHADAPHHVPARIQSLEGLRGYLALAVFICHAACWLYVFTGVGWQIPANPFYRNLGHISVSFFFMITAFLFWSKILNRHTKPIDWGHLFLSRVLRIVPLYLFAIAVFFVIIAALSGWALRVPASQLASSMLAWLLFTLPGTPDISAVDNTDIVIANVIWTLVWEWAFYFALPALAFFLRPRPPLLLALAGAATSLLIICFSTTGFPLPLFIFALGILAAHVTRIETVKRAAAHTAASILAIACVAGAFFIHPENGAIPLKVLQCGLLFTAFGIIAAGNTLGGVLDRRVSRTLGDMSYSLYLLHGPFLSILFFFILGFPYAQSLTTPQRWLIVSASTPALILLCFLTYRSIELPGMRATRPLHAWLKGRQPPSPDSIS